MVDVGYGELNDFLGSPIREHYAEWPNNVPCRDIRYDFWDFLMPIEGSLAWMYLKIYHYSIYSSRIFTVVLYNRWDKIVKQWPENYIPDTEEIRQVVIDNLREEGRRIE